MTKSRMPCTSLFLLLLGPFLTGGGQMSFSTALPLPTTMVALNSTEGMQMLYDPLTLKRPYEEGAIHYTTQQDTSSCGRASATIVLNALVGTGVPAPVDPTYNYPYWTQDAYTSSDCVASNCTEPCTLDQAARALNCTAGVHVEARPSSSFDQTDPVAELRELVREVCAEEHAKPDRRHIVANFDRASVNMAGGGHFSPVVAFSPARDMALVMDVARYKYPAAWFPMDVLWAGIDSYDHSARAYRGVYLTRGNVEASAPGAIVEA
mmetsp:Transcript_89443/g.255427  ORF Transcript_89443/g.255427 Transcript_89443/m.255427 type:complete len:265 (-) Transcript_89443:449-1243(-)